MNYLLLLIYLLTGALAGTLSGLFGIGGGIVVVPMLAFIFAKLHFNPLIVMHLAAGTSLAIMICTTGRSFISHYRHGMHFWKIYRQLLPGLIVGVLAGATLAHYLHSNILKIIFGVFLLIVGVKMLLDKKINPHRTLPHWPYVSSFGSLIGLKSGLLGIGGGPLTIPFLTYCNVPMRQAVLVSVATGCTVAVIGTISFLFSGMGILNLPDWATGFIYWPAWLGVALGSVVFAPLGAWLSHRLPVPLLKRIFAVFLLLAGVHMLW